MTIRELESELLTALPMRLETLPLLPSGFGGNSVGQGQMASNAATFSGGGIANQLAFGQQCGVCGFGNFAVVNNVNVNIVGPFAVNNF